MKVLDLACQHGHSFEGWFGSEEDFQSQLSRGLVQCPICDDAKISKKLSAPRLNLLGSKSMDPTAQAVVHERGVTSAGATKSIATSADNTPATGEKSLQIQHNTLPELSSNHPFHDLMRNPQFQEAYMQMAKEVLAKTEDVGKDFAREARKIHYGESKERGIRGEASKDDVVELLDEGIDVMPLPLPAALKKTLQ